MNRYKRDLPEVYLKPGEMHFAEHPTLVVTVLGSCLSITMFSPRLRIGGICHGLMPSCDGQKPCDDKCLESFKYVECSIRRMARLFDRYGVRRSEIEVKIFGGADMFSRDIKRPGISTIGKQNSIMAQKIIASEGLSLLAHDVGGLQGRKILFYTDTGEILLKRLTKVNNPDIKW